MERWVFVVVSLIASAGILFLLMIPARWAINWYIETSASYVITPVLMFVGIAWLVREFIREHRNQRPPNDH